MGFFFERPTMSDVKTIALNRAIIFLKAANCKYAIIPEEGEPIIDGVEIVLPKERKKRSPSVYKYGELAKHYKNIINLDVAPGVVQELPYGPFDPRVLCGSVSAWLSTHWGKESYITNKKESVLEILRVV